jgi:hypothetical protein
MYCTRFPAYSRHFPALRFLRLITAAVHREEDIRHQRAGDVQGPDDFVQGRLARAGRRALPDREAGELRLVWIG